MPTAEFAVYCELENRAGHDQSYQTCGLAYLQWINQGLATVVSPLTPTQPLETLNSVIPHCFPMLREKNRLMFLPIRLPQITGLQCPAYEVIRVICSVRWEYRLLAES